MMERIISSIWLRQTGDVPTELAAVYYPQRSGFMVSEGTQIEARSQVYCETSHARPPTREGRESNPT